MSLSFIARLLRPSGPELSELVKREMNPKQARGFDQICFGQPFAILALLTVGFIAAVIAPYRIIWRLWARR